MKSTHSQTQGPAIEVRNLRKSYCDVEAVRGSCFEVGRGEVFCLLGPNGAGKTTTVEILEGHRMCSGGEVRVLESDPAAGERELRDRVGIVLQQCGLQRDLTVAPAQELACAIRGAVAGERIVDPGLAAAALSEGESPLTAREHEVLLAEALKVADEKGWL